MSAAAEGGASVIHVDVMDGHFVPNLTIGPPVVKSLRKATKLPLDCHLMIENPDEFIPAFAEAGVDWMSVHQEACRHLNRTLQLIQESQLPGGSGDQSGDAGRYAGGSARSGRLCAGDVGESGIWSAEVSSSRTLHKMRKRWRRFEAQRGLQLPHRSGWRRGAGNHCATWYRRARKFWWRATRCSGRAIQEQNAEALLKTATEAGMVKV